MNLPTVVTGFGVWSAAGTSPEALWQSVRLGESPAAWHQFEGLRAIACVAPDPGPCPAFPQVRRMDRSAQLALAAALPAAAMARLESLDPTRIAVVVGNSRGPVGLWSTPPETRVRPTQAAHSAVGSLAGALSLALRARGPCFLVSATCASGAHAIALGHSLLAGGLADAVVAGGAEAPLFRPLLEQFQAAGLLGSDFDPRRACRPFDASRNGIIPGEGAAFLVLERGGEAARRGQAVLGELAGCGLAAESHNRVAARPDGDGLIRATRQALAAAGLDPTAIAHVNTHGTGTRVNDAAEAAALRQVFGGHLETLPLASTKPVTGHTFGAAAALEAVLTLQALREGCAPPTAGFTIPDPDLAVPGVARVARPIRGDHALSTSLGFWGNAAALVFRKAVGQIASRT
jgi:3-oxoacyl-[acyl-carrier-protein] synthase II